MFPHIRQMWTTRQRQRDLTKGNKFTYLQSVCRTIWTDVMSYKKRELLHYEKTYYIIGTNRKTEYFVYRWLSTIAMFDVTRFPAFVRASDVISSILLKPWFAKDRRHKQCIHTAVTPLKSREVSFCVWQYQICILLSTNQDICNIFNKSLLVTCVTKNNICNHMKQVS